MWASVQQVASNGLPCDGECDYERERELARRISACGNEDSMNGYISRSKLNTGAGSTRLRPGEPSRARTRASPKCSSSGWSDAAERVPGHRCRRVQSQQFPRPRRRWRPAATASPWLLHWLLLCAACALVNLFTSNSQLMQPQQQQPHFLQVQAFNLDTQSAIVHAGPANSYFGYSVAQHRDRGVNWLLVGAPKAQTNQPKLVAPGAVYRCAPATAAACQQVAFDPTGSSQVTQAGEQVQVDDKSHQWFGASLQSATENGSIVACAPNYVYFSRLLKRRDPVGNCYLSRGSFSSFLSYSPCRLDHQWGHHHMGSCQAGFAAAISKDGNRLFMAAPGSHVWQGQVFAHNLKTDLANSTSAVNPHSEDDSYLGYSLAIGRFSAANDPTVDHTDLAIGMPRGAELAGKVMLVDREMRTLRNITGEQVGAYFGYSLASIDFNGDGLDDLAIGAPLYYNRTQSDKEPHYDRGRVYLALQTAARGRHELHLNLRLDGQRNRARFGTALAHCGDLNRDGIADLAVGAPYDGPEGRGAVYIFMGRRNYRPGADSSLAPLDHDQVIYAESIRPEGLALRSFGFALSGGLDMDANSYADLLVGDYKADRAVLLRGRPVVNVTTSLAFAPENFNLDDRSCSLPSAPNISVACFTVTYCTKYSGLNVDSRLGFVHDVKLDTENRGAPRLFFLHNENQNEERNTSSLQKDVQQCKSFKAYITRQVRDKLTPIRVEVAYNLSETADTYDQTTGQSRLRPVLNRLAGGATHGHNKVFRSAMIQKNCGPDQVCVPDLSLSVTPNMDTYTIGSEAKLVLDVTVRNLGEDAYESMFYLIMPPTVHFIKINKTRDGLPICYNAKPDSLGENLLTCDLGNPQPRQEVVRFSVITEPARQAQFASPDFTFKAHVNSTNSEADDKRRENNEVVIGIRVQVEVQLVLSGSSQPPLVGFNTTRYQQQQQLLLGLGADSGAKQLSAPTRRSEAELGPEVYHTYQLQNRGPSAISDVAVSILWPMRTKDGAHYLLYLVDEPITSDKVKCKPVPEEAINPLGLKYLRGNSVQALKEVSLQLAGDRLASEPGNNRTLASRQRRQAGAGTQPDGGAEAAPLITGSSVDESVMEQMDLLACGPKQCTRFDCNVLDLSHNEVASIRIRSRLFEETITKLSMQEFDISSRLVAQIKALPHNVSVQPYAPYVHKVETTIHTIGLTVQDLLPWWLILLAILIGILLFILLVYFLRFLGFFARKRPPKTAEREPLTPTMWNDYHYTPGDTAL